MNQKEFFSTVIETIKGEFFLTGTYQSKIFGLVVDETNETAICSAPMPNKNLDDLIDLVQSVIKTKEVIQSFVPSLIEDGNMPLYLCHTELFTKDEGRTKIINTIKIEIDSETKKLKPFQFTKYRVENDEIFVDENGDMANKNVKLVEIEEEN